MSEKAISKYRSIRDVLLSEIKSGVYDGTGTLPGEHELVSRFGAARETLRRAILELEHLGLVRRKHGVGTFVCKRGGCRSGVIGLLIPSASVARIFKDFERQISRFARLGGYRLVVQEAEVGTLAETKVRLRRVAREMALKNLDGVIMRPLVDDRFAEVNKEIVRIFKNAQVPVVLIDSDIVSPPARSDCDLVSVDNVSAGRRVAEHLYRKGRRKGEGVQVDLLVQTAKSVCVVEIKRKRRIDESIEREVCEKLTRLKVPKDVSRRTALVYEGKLAQSVEDSGFFDFIIPVSDLLK